MLAFLKIHYDVDEPWTDLAIAAKTVLDPMIKVMEVLIKKDGTPEKRVS